MKVFHLVEQGQKEYPPPSPVCSLWGTRRCPRCTLQLTPPPPPGSQSLSPLPRKKFSFPYFCGRPAKICIFQMKTVRENCHEKVSIFAKYFEARCFLLTCPNINREFLNVGTVYLKTKKSYKLVSCDSKL
jgi:hypothetical protein